MTRVTEYVVDRVGSTWTLEDAVFVLDKIEQIEALARKLTAMRSAEPVVPPSTISATAHIVTRFYHSQHAVKCAKGNLRVTHGNIAFSEWFDASLKKPWGLKFWFVADTTSENAALSAASTPPCNREPSGDT